MAGLMFACFDGIDGAGLEAITLRMLDLVRDPTQKISHQLAAIRVIINVEKHYFQRMKRGAEQVGSPDAHPTASLRTIAQELLTFLNSLIERKEAEPALVLRASSLAIAIHKLAGDEQDWLFKQRSNPSAAAAGKVRSPQPSQRRARGAEHPAPAFEHLTPAMEREPLELGAFGRKPSDAPLIFDLSPAQGFLDDIFAHEPTAFDCDTGPPDVMTLFSQKGDANGAG